MLLEKHLLLMLDIFFQLLINFLVRFLLRITNIECTICWFNLHSVLCHLFWRRRVLGLRLLVLLRLYLRIQFLNILTCCHICKISLVCSCSLACPISFVSNIGCICLIRNFRLRITLTYLWHPRRWVHARFNLLRKYHRRCCVGIEHI